jgi:hypothetical protein
MNTGPRNIGSSPDLIPTKLKCLYTNVVHALRQVERAIKRYNAASRAAEAELANLVQLRWGVTYYTRRHLFVAKYILCEVVRAQHIEDADNAVSYVIGVECSTTVVLSANS